MDNLEDSAFIKLFTPSKWKLEKTERQREIRISIIALLLVITLLAW